LPYLLRFSWVSDVYDIASSEEALHLKQNLVAQLMIICILDPQSTLARGIS